MNKLKILLVIIGVLSIGATIVMAITTNPDDVRNHNTQVPNDQFRQFNFDVLDEGMREFHDYLGQIQTPESNPAPGDISPSDSMYNIILDPFERAGEWIGSMPNDQGVIKIRQLFGSPQALKEQTVSVSTPWPRYRTEDGRYNDYYFEERLMPGYERPEPDQENQLKLDNKYILGVKVNFLRRGYNWFAVYPPNPISLSGQVKSFGMWVCGRNKQHDLYVLVKDFHGEQRLVYVDSMNFLGWKYLKAQVPASITQSNYLNNDKRGLTFMGFVVMCDLEDSYGEYYLYFDNLSVELSRFWEESRDEYDPLDTW